MEMDLPAFFITLFCIFASVIKVYEEYSERPQAKGP